MGRFIFSRAALVVVMAATTPIVKAGARVHEVQVVAKKFSFEPATIQVSAGEAVRLVIRSADTTHGFSIAALNIEVQVPRHGEAVTVEFTAPPAGRYEIACSEFCGSGHGQMKAALVSAASNPSSH